MAGLTMDGLVWVCLLEGAKVFVIGVSFARYHARVSGSKWESWSNITELAQMRRWIDFLGVYSAPASGVFGAV